MGNAQQARSYAVLREEQPPAETLFEAVQAIAARRLRHLHTVNGAIPMQCGLKLWGGGEKLLQDRNLHPKAVASDLHDG